MAGTFDLEREVPYQRLRALLSQHEQAVQKVAELDEAMKSLLDGGHRSRSNPMGEKRYAMLDVGGAKFMLQGSVGSELLSPLLSAAKARVKDLELKLGIAELAIPE